MYIFNQISKFIYNLIVRRTNKKRKNPKLSFEVFGEVGTGFEPVYMVLQTIA